MADLTQTAANVGLAAASGPLEVVQAGGTVTQGNSVYLKSSDGKYWRTDADESAAAAAAKGIAMTAAVADGYFAIAKDGDTVNLGATLVVAETYIVSDTAGGIKPVADLTTGDYMTKLGVAATASSMLIKIDISGVAKP